LSKESLQSLRQPRARIRTLLVDDSPVALELLGNFLNSFPEVEVVGSAWNGEQGRTLAEQTLPDLVLADLEMPKVGGLDMTAALRKKFPAMRLVIISTHEGMVWEKLSESHGANAFVPKRSIAAQLPGLLARLFAGATLPVVPRPEAAA
jgi:DNA-binding NarL/FixJ family response regulator